MSNRVPKLKLALPVCTPDFFYQSSSLGCLNGSYMPLLTYNNSNTTLILHIITYVAKELPHSFLLACTHLLLEFIYQGQKFLPQLSFGFTEFCHNRIRPFLHLKWSVTTLSSTRNLANFLTLYTWHRLNNSTPQNSYIDSYVMWWCDVIPKPFM